jgi:hypothetical protein
MSMTKRLDHYDFGVKPTLIPCKKKRVKTRLDPFKHQTRRAVITSTQTRYDGQVLQIYKIHAMLELTHNRAA